MFRKHETIMADWPQTTLTEDKSGLHVTGKYRHPMTSRRVSAIMIILAIFTPLIAWGGGREFIPSMVLSGILIVIYFAALAPLARHLLRKKIDMKIYPDRLQIKGLTGYKTYPRTVPMELRVEPHRKGIEEVRREQQTGKATYTTYRDAVEVVLQYGERRVPLAAMRLDDLDKANALAFRLQDICEHGNDAMCGMAGGQASTGDKAAGDFGPAQEIR